MLKNQPKITIVTATVEFTHDLITSARTILPLLSESIHWLIVSKHEHIHHGKLVRFDSPYARTVVVNDSGLYDALNKALDLLDSGYIQVVGAGDQLLPEGFRSALSKITEHRDEPVHAFPIHMARTDQIFAPEPELLQNFMSCPHPGMFMDVELIKFHKGFDTRYIISADYDLLSRTVKQSKVNIRSDVTLPVVRFKGGGLSDIRGNEALLENALIGIRVWDKSFREALRSK